MCVVVVCVQPSYLHFLLVEANDGQTFAYSFPAALIADGTHPWTVALMEKSESESERENIIGTE